MMGLSKEEFHKLADTISEAVKEHCGEIGRRAAEDMVHRVLDADNSILKHQVKAIIRTQIEEEVGKHISVQVSWK